VCFIYTCYETHPSLSFVFDYPLTRRHIPEELNPQLRTAETSELADKDAHFRA